MCTMVWGKSGKTLWLCFNRDERRNRPDADLPKIRKAGNNRIVYAVDPQGGGTWLAVSEAGYAVAIMNHYSGNKELADAGQESRGAIPLRLIQSQSMIEAEGLLSGMVLQSTYAPFYLFILSAEKSTFWTWDGCCLEQSDNCPQFWTTSSYKPNEVCSRRVELWKKAFPGEPVSFDEVTRILKEGAVDPAFGMTMDRPDARTVSQASVVLSRNHLKFQYARRLKNGFSYEEPVVTGW